MRLSGNSQTLEGSVNPNALRIVGKVPEHLCNVLEKYLSKLCGDEGYIRVIDGTFWGSGLYPTNSYMGFVPDSYTLVREGGFFAIWGTFADLSGNYTESEKYAEFLKKKTIDGHYRVSVRESYEWFGEENRCDVTIHEMYLVIDDEMKNYIPNLPSSLFL